MIVSRVVLKNWRNFRSVDVRLGDRAFLVGPNASGKSNFLDVFRFLRDIAKPGGGLQPAVTERGGLSKLRSLFARKEPDVEIKVELSNGDVEIPEWVYDIGIKQEPRGFRQPYLTYERVSYRGKKILNRPDGEDRTDQLRLTQTHLEQIAANESFREVARFFSTILYLHLIPQLLRHPEQMRTQDMPDDPFGSRFLERITKTPEKTRQARLRKIERALQAAVPQLRNLTHMKDELGVPHLEAVYEHWRPGAGKQREDQFSDGTLRLIALLWVLMEGESLLLLEEPELSLHASIVAKLPAVIHRALGRKKRQVLISTHSFELLTDAGIGGEETLMLQPQLEGTEVTLAARQAEVEELLHGGLTIAEAVLPRTAPKDLMQLSLFE